MNILVLTNVLRDRPPLLEEEIILLRDTCSRGVFLWFEIHPLLSFQYVLQIASYQ